MLPAWKFCLFNLKLKKVHDVDMDKQSFTSRKTVSPVLFESLRKKLMEAVFNFGLF